MTTLTDRLAYPNIRKTFLLEITAGEHLYHWTSSGGGVYYASTVAAPSRPVADVKEDGASLTEGASASLSAGQWYWDRTNERIYVHPTGSVSPYTVTLQALIRFYFSNRPRVYNGNYYEPIISSLPDLSLRVEKDFGDVGQLGAGNLSMVNRGGFFDALTDLRWDAGLAVLKLGVDDPSFSASGSFYLLGTEDVAFVDDAGGSFVDDAGGAFIDETAAGVMVPIPGYAMATYAEFDTVGTFSVRTWTKTNATFTLKLEEPKAILKKKIPVTLFDRATYPNLPEDRIGDPIPVAYGEIYDIEPVCIDPSTMTFKVAGHGIRAFESVRVYDDTLKYWKSVAFASTDLVNGEFTLSASDWDAKAQVAVDFKGKEISTGVIMDNASDVVNDLLNVELGISSSLIDATTFAQSNTRLEIGADRYNKQYNHRRVSVYLDKQVSAEDVIGAINEVVGSYLFCDHTGVFRYIVFEPEPGDGLTVFDETSIFSFEEVTETKDIVSSIRGKYRYESINDRWQSYVYPDPSAQYLKGDPSAIIDELETGMYREVDAQYVTQRTVRMAGFGSKVWRVKVSHIGWPKLPAKFAIFKYPRHGINDVLEILEVKRSLPGTTVELTVGNLHGLKDQSGFWVGDSHVFPASLGGGSCATWDSGWTAAQKAWARQNVGYWTDDNGFADSADPDSFMCSVWV